MNYFNITAEAPLGPTEFSQVPDKIKPYYNSNGLGKEFNGPVYLVPTDPERGFIPITPQTPLDTYMDIYSESLLAKPIQTLETLGWTPEKMGWTRNIEPWKNTTYSELLSLCRIISPTSLACDEISKYPLDDMVRNLAVLSTLVDAAGLPITAKRTSPWYQKYISYGVQNNLLTDDFVNKKWYTRAELLELAGNIIQWRNNSNNSEPKV